MSWCHMVKQCHWNTVMFCPYKGRHTCIHFVIITCTECRCVHTPQFCGQTHHVSDSIRLLITRVTVVGTLVAHISVTATFHLAMGNVKVTLNSCKDTSTWYPDNIVTWRLLVMTNMDKNWNPETDTYTGRHNRQTWFAVDYDVRNRLYDVITGAELSAKVCPLHKSQGALRVRTKRDLCLQPP
jgi:hypothetical protein